MMKNTQDLKIKTTPTIHKIHLQDRLRLLKQQTLGNQQTKNQEIGETTMDKINPTILKATIEAIPVLTEETFSSWQTCITVLCKLGGVKNQMLEGNPSLDKDDNTTLCSISFSKLSKSIQKPEYM
ncbi:hypothetical protein VP01_3143g5 [Puccinia sorghi]|uniref:Uncharacterized protein n=1 Tax=Puccinia sorghi TaxID=27349 RepID=A0A0L6V0T2_9BASI|nr:hypothetical protein VP01_3143g5 [Puccinia sorghi]